PTFGVQSPKRVIARTFGVPDFADAAYQLREAVKISRAKKCLLAAGPEYDLSGAPERLGFVSEAGTSKLQAVTTKSDLRGRQNTDFGLGHQGLDLRDGSGEAAAC